MKRFFSTLLVSVLTSVCMMAQMNVWSNGRIIFQREYSLIDSITFALPEQQEDPYEDLLDLDPAQIEEAGYVNLYGTWRIMAAVREKPTEYLMIYYVSIETGLLEAAERRDGDRVIYRMTAEQADLAAPEDDVFLLPGEGPTNS